MPQGSELLYVLLVLTIFAAGATTVLLVVLTAVNRKSYNGLRLLLVALVASAVALGVAASLR